jgi:hypothetical protein
MDATIFALMMPVLMTVLSLSKSDAGLLGSISLIGSALGGWGAGMLADRYGRIKVDQHLSVAAGIRQQLAKDAAKAGGMRLLDEHFMVIRQAMGLPKAKGAEAAQYLADFVEQMKASGFVAAALARHHIEGAGVAGKDD